MTPKNHIHTLFNFKMKMGQGPCHLGFGFVFGYNRNMKITANQYPVDNLLMS